MIRLTRMREFGAVFLSLTTIAFAGCGGSNGSGSGGSGGSGEYSEVTGDYSCFYNSQRGISGGVATTDCLMNVSGSSEEGRLQITVSDEMGDVRFENLEVIVTSDSAAPPADAGMDTADAGSTDAGSTGGGEPRRIDFEVAMQEVQYNVGPDPDNPYMASGGGHLVEGQEDYELNLTLEPVGDGETVRVTVEPL